jgi:peptidoglycan/LPS O-acetylase OafA/YrhL
MTFPIPQKIGKRLHFLDGLRGWGALVVVFYHVFVFHFPVSEPIRDFTWKIFFSMEHLL